jgi:hypothetical protein
MNSKMLAVLAVLPLALRAQGAIPPADEQIAAAVLPLPADMRADATVMGYRTAGKLEVLRPGKAGAMHCLALYVSRPDFHVACYHEGLEAFMARGREIRDQNKGIKPDAVDSMRFAEVKSGKLKMPPVGALYSLSGKKEAWDAATRKATNVTPLGVIYMPGATTASTGISSNMGTTGPWLMYPGTAKAHVMVVGSMQ